MRCANNCLVSFSSSRVLWCNMSPPVSLCTLKCGSTIALSCIGDSNVLYLSVICWGDGEETSTTERCSCRLVLHHGACVSVCLCMFDRSQQRHQQQQQQQQRQQLKQAFLLLLSLHKSSLASIHTPPLFHSSRLSCVSRFFPLYFSLSLFLLPLSLYLKQILLNLLSEQAAKFTHSFCSCDEQ